MKYRLFTTISIIVFLSVCFNLSISYAKQYEIMGQEAEDEGKLREALTYYMSALKSTSEESSGGLREKIIKLVQKIEPPPSVPEEALRHMGRAKAAFEIAKGYEDYKRAIDEFRKAVRLAPWLADGYYNLAVVQEKAGDFDDAMRNFKLYIFAAPSATDTEEVKTRIYGLEYKSEQQQEKERVKEAKLRREERAREARLSEEREQERADERLAQQLSGIWHPPAEKVKTLEGRTIMFKVCCRIKIRTTGNEVHARYIGVSQTNSSMTKSWYSKVNLPAFEAKVERGRLIGKYHSISFGAGGASIFKTGPYDVKIEMSYDGRSFTEIWKGGGEQKYIKE